MRSGLFVLACLLALPGSLVLAAELSEGAGEIQTVSEDVMIVSYRTSSGTHIILSETTKTAYPFVEVNLVGSGFATVTLDGESSSVPLSSGITRIIYSFESGSSHSLSVICGSISESYSFKISSTISVKELDPDSEELVSMYESELRNEKIIAALTAFVSACVGIYAAFRIARWRASNGVETL